MNIQRRFSGANTDIEIYLDSNLHILDREMSSTMSVSNTNMNRDYIKEIMGWIGDYAFNRIFLYHSDGIVTEWVNNQFHIVDCLEPELIIGFWST